jgi:hypothetical protein
MAAVVGAGEQNLWVGEFQGLIPCISLRECSSVALLLTQESKACGKQEFWSLISCLGFRQHSPFAMLLFRRIKPECRPMVF